MADACNQPEKGKEISSQAEKGSDESFGFGDDLELNQFDGLPYSTRYYTLLKERKKLPIWDRRSEFLKSLENNQLIIVSGSAKTGKSTQIPQWCAEFCLAGEYQHGMVVCTQTLRQQAVDLALRVADEMDVNIGHEVGYSIPLETCCSHDTILRFCTDEILLREMMSDPFLRHYGALVIDQTQERTVSTDVLLGLLQEVLLHRPGLRAVLLSAQPFSDRLLLHYGPVPHLRAEVPSSTEVVYSNSGQKESFYSALRLALEIHRTRERGHIAVFLASEQEVDCAYTILCKEGSKLSATLGELVPVILCPGHVGTFPTPAEEPSKKRRVYLSCSQSEDMFWPVDMVNFLIDTGVERRFVYNPWIRASTEVTKPISRSQAEIRKQLTTSTGKCFRLYPEETKLPAEPPPMLMECSITPTVLFLKRLEVAGLHSCHFIDRPDPEGLMQALEELDYLAALDDDGNLSEIGIIMSEFPLDPQMAKALLASCEYDCVSEVLTIAAMLAAPSCFLEPPFGMATEALQCHTKLQHPEGDHFMLINIYNTFKRCQREPYFCLERWCQDYFLCCGALHTADALRAELADILRRIELPVSEPAFGTKSNTLNIKRALLAGYFMQVARDVDGSGNYFMLTNKHMTQIHPLSCYGTKGHKLGLPEWVLYHEYTLSENRIRTISQISPQVFVEMMPQYFFYNLPPSESKEILQHILNSKESASCGRNRSEQPIGRRNGSGQPVSSEKRGDSGEGASYDRCVVQ